MSLRSHIWIPALVTTSVPAPVLTSLDFDLASTAGGASITITGTDLDDAISCEVDGVIGGGWTSATITANTSTSLTFTMPFRLAGTYNVRVTTAGGTSNALSIEAWYPSQVSAVDCVLHAAVGVTQASGAVSLWVDQINANHFAMTTPSLRPAYDANGFGPGRPSVKFSPQQRLDTSVGERTLSNGKSIFAVVKWTSADATASQAFTVPLALVSEASAAYVAFGASGDAVAFATWNTAGSANHRITGGSGLNDGQARLIGVTSDTAPNEKLYVGHTQVGSTNSPSGGYTTHGYTRIGNAYQAADGWDGDVGLIVIVDGVIDSSELTKLHKFAQAEFGAL